jgi:hypothetical protein
MSAKLASNGKKSEFKGIDAFKKTPLAMNFVKRQKGAWTHEDWLGFLNDIESKGYVCNPDEIGLLLEVKKEEYWAKIDHSHD